MLPLVIIRKVLIGSLFALLLAGCGATNGKPTVDLIVQDDPVQGWNLYMSTNNFSFTPEELSTGADDNEGYALLTVNGQVITRLYSEWTYMPGLPVGSNTISVTLYHNDHTPVMIEGVEVSDAAVVVAN